MHPINIRLRVASAAIALLPLPAVASDAPSARSIAALTVTSVTGRAAIRVTGTVVGSQRLQAVVSATFGPDIPTVILSRQPVTVPADGRIDVILTVAPAYFVGTTITVVLNNARALSIGRGSVVPNTLPNQGAQ